MELLDHLVIPAAGRGTRMAQLTGGSPKELLDVGGKPAIQLAVEEGIDAGITSITIVISRNKEKIRRRLEKAFARNRIAPSSVRIRFLYQEEPRGEADAIALAEQFAAGRPVAVIYPDNIYFPAPGALRILKDSFAQHGEDTVGLTSVTLRHSPALGNAGHVEVTPLGGPRYLITGIKQKAEGRFIPRHEGELRACGMWISGDHLFPMLRRARRGVTSGEFTDGHVRQLIMRERRYVGHLLPGILFDIGSPEGYRACRTYVSLRHGA